MTDARPRLYLQQDARTDRLTALEFGRIDDGQPGERWTTIGEVGLLHEEVDGRCIGFVVLDVSEYDPDDDEYAELWDAPRFDVPALGLTDVSPNAVIVATRALFGAATTVNRELFRFAIHGDGEVALRRWLRCLQAGDSMAHYALGYTLYDLGRVQEAYRHLRYYCEIAPGEAWAWWWYGKAAAAVGEDDEARVAFDKAIEIDDDGEGPGEDAAELLVLLDAGLFPYPDPPAVDAEDDEHEDAFTRECRATVGALGIPAATLTGNMRYTAVLELDPPVWVDIDRETPQVFVRAQAGTFPAAVPSDARERLLDRLDEPQAVSAQDDVLWTGLSLEVQELGPGVLRALARGVADSARELRPRAEALGVALTPPPDFENVLRTLVDEL